MPRFAKLGAALIWLALPAAWAADLQLGPLQTAGPGSTVFVPVHILTAPGESLAALQFDLVWDRPGLTAVSTAGGAVRSSLKRLYRSNDGAAARHLVAALNQETVKAEEQPGTLVNLFILVDGATPAGSWTLSLENAVAVSGSGDLLDLRGARTTLVVDPGLPANVLPPEALVHAATLGGTTAVAPGTLFRLIGPGTDLGLDLTVSVGGLAAQVHLAGPRWIEFQVPADAPVGGAAQVEVRQGGNTVASVPCQVAESLPGLFTTDASGTGPAVASNPDSEPNTALSPAPRKGWVTLYGTGLGSDPASVAVWLSGRLVPVTAIQPDPAGRPGIQTMAIALSEEVAADLFTQVSAGPSNGTAFSPAGVQISLDRE
ncbi:MAG: hypothetical protein IT162_04110 [Bryobacterales bacterium]|nr:hypothetical protein [Bryobacterales bacterium]